MTGKEIAALDNAIFNKSVRFGDANNHSDWSVSVRVADFNGDDKYDKDNPPNMNDTVYPGSKGGAYHISICCDYGKESNFSDVDTALFIMTTNQFVEFAKMVNDAAETIKDREDWHWGKINM